MAYLVVPLDELLEASPYLAACQVAFLVSYRVAYQATYRATCLADPFDEHLEPLATSDVRLVVVHGLVEADQVLAIHPLALA